MKFVKFALASLAMVSMAACSENNEVAEGEMSVQGEGYMTLSIEMPNADKSTRSTKPEGDGIDPGTIGEQKISKISVWVYDQAGTALPEQHTFEGALLKPQAPNPVKPSETTTYTLPPFAVKQGVKEIVVVVNPLAAQFDTPLHSQNKPQMQEMKTLSEEEIKAISTPGQFMMINANNQVGQSGIPTVTVGKENNKNNPAIVTVEVERVVAKIEEKTYPYTFQVTNGTAQDQVTFTEVALINGNKKFFPIKKVETKADGAQYVVDPNFEKNEQNAATDFYAKDFTTYPTTYVEKLSKTGAEMAGPCFYTLENTMTAQEQKNANTTGLYYKATYQLASNPVKDANVYQFAGKLYSWSELQKAASNLGLNLAQLNDATSTQDDFDKIGVKKYEKGVCYYPYWIRHIDNLDNTVMGAMEFAVVRNNYYQMTVSKVKGIGEYKPTTPDPNTPDELVESFLDVKVKVLPWIVRSNNIEF